jgi:hypothetical protein
MADEQTKTSFLELKSRYFEPLCQRLGLAEGESTFGVGYGIAQAGQEHLRVYFEYERGLSSFSLGPSSAPKPACSVETIAQRFPRIRALATGEQRLSLDEQRDFLQTHWPDLQRMFAPDGLDDTRRWLQQRAAALTARFAKGS